jgi:CDP-diacylglycerol--serine O-phosphatidyltransferase
LQKLRYHIPNAITSLNLAAGCLSIAYASLGHLKVAAILVFAAAILDFSDGLAARILKTSSSMGVQLDSLADMVSFGLAPAFLVFRNASNFLISSDNPQDISSAGGTTGIAIFIPFILSVFAALRLAKFNVDVRQSEHFIGLPTPAMAIFFVSAIYSLQDTDLRFMNAINHSIIFWDGLAIMFSVLMVSELKMIGMKFKNLAWSDNQFQYLFIGISAILLISLQAMGIPLIILWYIILSFVYHVNNAKTASL